MPRAFPVTTIPATAQDPTVAHALRRHAAENPRRTAVRVVRYDGGEPSIEEIDYGDLDRRAHRLATWLLARCSAGDRVLLAYPDGIDLAVAFVACFYAGVVPLHPALPARGRSGPDAPVWSAVRDAGVRLALTGADRLERIRELLVEGGLAGSVRVAAPEPLSATGTATATGTGTATGTDTDDGCDGAWPGPPPAPDGLAFLQYTSGSTGDPRGVMISHGALAANARALIELAGGTPEDTFCGWLPLHHDMGLVGQLMTPLHAGGTTVMLGAADFVRHPLRWLQLIERYRAAHTAVPNFALDLCCRRVRPEQAAGLDLSSLAMVLCGAEPVDPDTLDAFAERFAPAGLDVAALKPAYGLAEATLMVTATHRGTRYRTGVIDADALRGHRLEPVTAAVPASRHVPVVGCGGPQSSRVRIVDPGTGAVLVPGRVGEIWVAGPGVAAGYWRRPELTARTFGARTPDGDGPWLRTGDLGALWDGELVVTGRLKEVVVVRGRNVYPHDVERLVPGLHPALAGLVGAAFGVAGRGEELVVVHEIRQSAVDRGELPALGRTIREALTEGLGVPVTNVVLVPAGTVLRTTSGKVQRLAMRSEFLAARLRVLHEDLSAAVRGTVAGGRGTVAGGADA